MSDDSFSIGLLTDWLCWIYNYYHYGPYCPVFSDQGGGFGLQITEVNVAYARQLEWVIVKTNLVTDCFLYVCIYINSYLIAHQLD